MNHLSSGSLKRMARTQLFGKLGTVIGAFLLHMLCLFPIMLVSFGVDSVLMIIVYFVISFLVEIYASFLMAGESLIYLKIAGGMDAGVLDLFFAFREDPIKVIKVRALPALFVTVAQIPMILVSVKITATVNTDDLLVMMQNGDSAGIMSFYDQNMPLMMLNFLVMIGWVVVSFVINMIFSQTYYLMLDYPDYSAMEVLFYGVKLMKGSYLRYIYLSLSFLPWYMLAFFSCGISMVWAYPYSRAAFANFYIDLVRSGSEGR